MNWCRRANKLTEILRKHPADTSMVHLMKSLGFDGAGDVLKDEEPMTEERKKKRKQGDEMEHEHGSA